MVIVVLFLSFLPLSYVLQAKVEVIMILITTSCHLSYDMFYHFNQSFYRISHLFDILDLDIALFETHDICHFDAFNRLATIL